MIDIIMEFPLLRYVPIVMDFLTLMGSDGGWVSRWMLLGSVRKSIR